MTDSFRRSRRSISFTIPPPRPPPLRPLLGRERPQPVRPQLRTTRRGPAPDAQSRDLPAPQRRLDALEAPVPAARPARPQAQGPERQVDVIADDQQILGL